MSNAAAAPDADDARSAPDAVQHTVRAGRGSQVGRILARIGIASRAVVYAALAVLTVQLAVGPRPDDADQAGALRELGSNPAGRVLLWLLVAGVACYVLWRFSEVVAGPSSGEDGTGSRVLAGLEGAAYVPIAVMAFAAAVGDSAVAQQGDKYRSLSATVMHDWPGGRLLVGAVGLVVAGVGAYLASQGPRRSFLDDLAFGSRRRAERVVTALGTVGSTARGVVIGLAGVLVVAAAVTTDPDKAGGVDAALRSLADTSFGPWLLLVVAAGLAAFAAFAVGEARYRTV